MPVRISQGVYQHRGRWRHRITEAPGLYSWAPAGLTQAEARELAEGYADAFQARRDVTVGGIVDRYLEWLTAKGRKAVTIGTTRTHLQLLLEPLSHLEVVSVTVRRARERYTELVKQSVRTRIPDERGRVRQAVARVAYQQRWILQKRVSDPRRRLTDEEVKHRWAQLDVFEERGKIGDIDKRKTDSPFLGALWRKAEAMSKRLAKRAEPPRKTVAAATHHEALDRARSAWKWAQREGIAKTNPWTDVDKVGRANRGKPQLRIDEARKLADVCMREVMTSDAALGILLAQTMGLRVSEVQLRVVRDVDDDYRLLWIPDTKTPAGRRALAIPHMLQSAVQARVEGQPHDAPLIRLASGQRPSRAWFGAALHAFCDRAGIPRICLHALRGQWATIAVESGALTHAVAEALGHASFKVTAQHYAKQEAIDSVKQRKRLKVLSGGRK